MALPTILNEDYTPMELDIVDIIKKDGRFGVVEGAEEVRKKIDEMGQCVRRKRSLGRKV
jgi:hypothetical protein